MNDFGDNDPWLLADDYPVVRDTCGEVLARFSDFVWTLNSGDTCRPQSVNFGDGPQRVGSAGVDRPNAYLLRRIVAWWLLRERPYEIPSTVVAYFVALRPIFVLCSERGMKADNLVQYPEVVDEISSVIAPSKANDAIMLLHAIHVSRKELGFTLLDDSGLRRLNAALPNHQAHQTAYIPPRIWLYQVTRLREFIDDFLRHRESIEDCFSYCLGAYIIQRGGDKQAIQRKRKYGRAPFTQPSPGSKYARYLGPFAQTAEQFGILSLLKKWTVGCGAENTIKIMNLSNYLTAASRVAVAYVANMSLMRISEVWDLRAGCLIVENDENFGPIYTLSSRTSKTYQDDDARWITSPSTVDAIEVALAVSKLRMKCDQENSRFQLDMEKHGAQRLFVGAYEPWSQRYGKSGALQAVANYPSYQNVLVSHPKLFSADELRITESDLEVASLVNSDLDRNIFSVGVVWPFSWHQLRRTGAVNMQSSGLVSDFSMQYQLKHARRAMSLYYGRGFGKLKLQRDAATTYIRAMYEAIGTHISELTKEVFLSPYGIERKEKILELVAENDHAFLVKAAKNGAIAWRETMFGVCTKRGPCPYGGIDNVIRCGGGDGKAPCADALFDKRKRSQIHQLRSVIVERITGVEPGS